MTTTLPNTETLQRLLEQAPSYILFTDQDMRIRYVNRTSYGYAPKDVIGNDYLSFLPPDQRKRVSARFQRAMETGEEQLSESVIDTPAGSRIWLSTRISVVRDAEGRALGFVSITTDVTEQKHAELALEKTRKELIDASHRAGMAEVATGVLHNIGNVLNSLSVAAHMAEQLLQKSRLPLLGEAVGKLEKPPEELARYLTDDAQGAKFPRLLRRVADELLEERERLMAELTRVNQQVELMQATIAAQQAFAQTNLFVQEVDLGSLIERVVSIFRIEIENRKIGLQLEVQPARVTLDTQSTMQILANLVRNALEAMEQTGDPDSRPRKLLLRAGVRDGRLVIDVEDNGCGIEESVRTRMFQHGFTTKPNGHGFGLHASAIAAQAMGGTLTAHSDGAGRGARFRLDLPDRQPVGEQKSAS